MKRLSRYRPSLTPSTQRPYGALKDKDSTAGSKVVAEHVNEVMYSLYAVMQKAGITPNDQDENINDSQFLTALTDLFENNAPYKVGKTYNVGDTFTIGGVTHIVIPEADGLTARFSDAVGAFAGLTSAQETALANKRTGYITSLKAGYERFRAEAVPLHLYEKGISSPVVDGINLTDKYPKFFANCNGLNASGQYNTSRKAFIDDNLPYLVTGGVYKTFDVPAGFGIVNTFNDASIGTKTGGLPTKLASVLFKSSSDTSLTSLGSGHIRWPHTTHMIKFEIGYINDYTLGATQIYWSKQNGVTENIDYQQLNNDPTKFIVDMNISNYSELVLCKLVPPQTSTDGTYKEVDETYTTQTSPNTGAGLQLGYYTLLKMV